MKPITQENRIYLAIWRKALKTGGKIELKMADASLALSTRMAMYRAIRPYREGKEIDLELIEAAERYVITYQKSPPMLALVPRRSLSAAEAMMADLGLDADDLLTPEELDQRMRMLEIQDEATPNHIETPFYSREG